MTKTEALIKCRDHWQWITDNVEHLINLPYRNMDQGEIKKAYFIEKGILEIPDSECYCCAYDALRGESCTECPLTGYAWKNWCYAHSDIPTTYLGWFRAVSKRDAGNAKYFASRMVAACEMALLDENKGE